MQYFLPPKNAILPHYIRFFILLVICLIIHFVFKMTLTAVLILCAVFAGLIYITMKIDNFYMYIKGDRLIIKSGIFTKRTAAFSNLRLIYIKQSCPVIERIFGISNVSMHGYGTHFLFFPLENESAKNLIHLCGVENEAKDI